MLKSQICCHLSLQYHLPQNMEIIEYIRIFRIKSAKYIQLLFNIRFYLYSKIKRTTSKSSIYEIDLFTTILGSLLACE